MRDYYIAGKEIKWNILNECFRLNQHGISRVFLVVRSVYTASVEVKSHETSFNPQNFPVRISTEIAEVVYKSNVNTTTSCALKGKPLMTSAYFRGV